MVKQKVVIGVLKHAESKSGLCFVLTLLLHRFLATFQFSVFRKKTRFWVKLGSQIFRNIHPWWGVIPPYRQTLQGCRRKLMIIYVSSMSNMPKSDWPYLSTKTNRAHVWKTEWLFLQYGFQQWYTAYNWSIRGKVTSASKVFNYGFKF